ncbi:MAG: hypothetical protein SGI91_01185 [Alphaproteobacteria bacterium]|nr:hypothetical protein [Alphaproteobacteria bacterium]
MRILQGDPDKVRAVFVTQARKLFRDRSGAGAVVDLALPALHVIATLTPAMQVTMSEQVRTGTVQVAWEDARAAFWTKGRELFRDGASEPTDVQVVEFAVLTQKLVETLRPSPPEHAA